MSSIYYKNDDSWTEAVYSIENINHVSRIFMQKVYWGTTDQKLEIILKEANTHNVFLILGNLNASGTFLGCLYVNNNSTTSSTPSFNILEKGSLSYSPFSIEYTKGNNRIYLKTSLSLYSNTLVISTRQFYAGAV